MGTCAERSAMRRCGDAARAVRVGRIAWRWGLLGVGTLSTNSSAMARYVDHLPPQMNVTPVFSSWPMTWWRETGAPGGAFGSR
eukprot:2368292-Prymnesium_polylepis.1